MIIIAAMGHNVLLNVVCQNMKELKIKIMKQQHVFIFGFQPCIYESAMAAMSIHKTKVGAYKAMRKYLMEEYAKWYDMRMLYGKRDWRYGSIEKYGTHCAWAVYSEILYE